MFSFPAHRQVSPQDLGIFCLACPQLQRLTLGADGPLIYREGALKVLQFLPSLRELSLCGQNSAVGQGGG